MRELKIDPEFKNKIPPLTDQEFDQLRENILADGEVYEPIVVWDGTIVDGHNRWRIIQENPDIPFRVKEMDFSDKWAAFEWMYKKQLGRRNLTDQQRTMLIAKMYEAIEHGSGGDRKSEDFSRRQNGALISGANKTAKILAQELGIGQNTVNRAVRFAKGMAALEKISPEAADKVMTGKASVTKGTIQELRRMSAEQQQEVAQAIMSDEPIFPKKEHTNPKGFTKADRESRAETEAIIAEMYDPSTVPEFTIEMLIEEIQVNGDMWVSTLRNILTDRSTLLTEENRPKIDGAIGELVGKFRKVRDLIQ